jgi:phenylacetate-CoA ligase
MQRLQQFQWRPAEELQARSLDKLRALLAHAETNVPYYRTLFRQAGVQVQDLTTIDDLRHVPVTTKKDLRAAFPEGVVAGNLPASRRRRNATTGSTGMPFQFFNDGREVNGWLGSYLFFRQWAGVELWDTRVSIAEPGQFNRNPARLPRLAHLARRFLAGERYVPLHGAIFSAQAFFELACSLRPGRYFIAAFPSYANRLATQLLELDLPLTAHPTTVITSAETLTEADAARIRRAFHCPVVNHYSTWEAPHIAQTCPDRPDRLHVQSERVILRVVREDGSDAAPGQEGRVLLTNLNNYVMPFVNYDLGDRAVAGSVCGCGRGFPTLDAILGRSAELLLMPDGRAISATGLTYAIPSRKIIEYVSEYQAVQMAADTVVLRLVPTSRFNADFSRDIQRALEALFGAGVTVTVETVDRIPTEPSGKRLVIKSALTEPDRRTAGRADGESFR